MRRVETTSRMPKEGWANRPGMPVDELGRDQLRKGSQILQEPHRQEGTSCQHPKPPTLKLPQWETTRCTDRAILAIPLVGPAQNMEDLQMKTFPCMAHVGSV